MNAKIPQRLMVCAFLLMGIVIVGLFVGEFFFNKDGSKKFMTEAVIHSILSYIAGLLSAGFMFYFGSAENGHIETPKKENDRHLDLDTLNNKVKNIGGNN